MMQSEGSPYASVENAKQPPCPSSPAPGFKVPEVDFEDYYNKLPKYQLELLNENKNAKVKEADVKKMEAIIEADNRKQAAKDAYEAAECAFNKQRLVLDKKATYRKEEIKGEYRKSLIDMLPKNYFAPADTDIEKDDKIPKDQKAIKIAELHQKLAIEELSYLEKVKEYQQSWSLAENNWKLAQEQCEADKCTAEATEKKAERDADLEWRTAISQALAEANK